MAMAKGRKVSNLRERRKMRHAFFFSKPLLQNDGKKSFLSFLYPCDISYFAGLINVVPEETPGYNSLLTDAAYAHVGVLGHKMS